MEKKTLARRLVAQGPSLSIISPQTAANGYCPDIPLQIQSPRQ